MKINIPKVVIPVELSAYAPELAGQCLYVWVNPPKQTLQAYDQLVTDLQTQELGAAKEKLFPQKQEGAEMAPLRKAFELMQHWLRIKKEQPTEGIDHRLLTWFIEIWNHGPAESRWDVDELLELEAQDPSFLSWMIAQTWQARAEHIERKKKT